MPVYWQFLEQAFIIVFFFLADWALQDSFAGEDKMVWLSFVMATPGTVKAHIQAKYCFVLLLNIMLLIYCVLDDMIACLLFQGMEVSVSVVPVVLVCYNLVKEALAFPFIYGYGTKHGTTMKLIFLIMVVCVFAVYGLFGDISWFLEGNVFDRLHEFFFDGNGVWILGLFPYVAIALFYGSYRLCLKIYRRGLENIE